MVIVVLVSSVFGVSAQTNNNSDERIFIDSRLPEKDKAVLKDIMAHLDKEDRENVIFIAEDGWFTANKLELIEEFKKQNKDKVDKDGKLKEIDLVPQESLVNVYEKVCTENHNNQTESLQESSLVSVTPTGYQPPSTQLPSANSGPYRRVLSVTGNSRLTSNIYLPDKALSEAYMNPQAVTTCTHLDPNTGLPLHSSTGDQGYIYTGAVTSGGQIDMGLALNYASGSNPWNETWGMFVHGHSSVVQSQFGNYKMGQTIFMKYYTPQDNQAALYVAGKDKAGVKIENTLVVEVSSSKNFKANGQGMKLKRVTSVAQNTGHEKLTTGSFIKNIGWYNVKIGTTSGSEVLMNSSNTESSGGYKIENVRIDYTDPANEQLWVKCGTSF